MRRLLAVLVLASFSVNAETITFGTDAINFQMEFVHIGDPNNPPDVNPIPLNRGSVSYSFAVGKYEVSRDQFLKAIAAGYPSMPAISIANLAGYGGNDRNRPATGVSWHSAARFINWLNTTKGYSAAYKFTDNSPTGSISLWAPSDPGYDSSNLFRNSLARFFLPSLDEWHKAAYFNPVTREYFSYATGSNSAPSYVQNGTDQNTVVSNMYWATGPASVYESGGLSAYGAMSLAGNASEWLETSIDRINSEPFEARAIFNSYWNSVGIFAADQGLEGWSPDRSDVQAGFRIAMVPEPSSLSLLLAGGAVLMAGRRRK